MTILRQPSLFRIQELYDVEPPQKYDAIISAIDLDFIDHEMKGRFHVAKVVKRACLESGTTETPMGKATAENPARSVLCS